MAAARALARLEWGLRGGDTYEAQQQIKAFYSRQRSKKQVDSYQLLSAAARLQLTMGQDSCGAELAMLLLQDFFTDSVRASTAWIACVQELLAAFPQPGQKPFSDLAPELCSRFALEALKWLRRLPEPGPEGEAAAAQAAKAVHLTLASYISACFGSEGLGWASQHLALAHDPSSFARAVAQAVRDSAAPAEEHLFIVRAALQILAVTPASAQAVADCAAFLAAYRADRRTDLPSAPLISCLKLVQQALAKRDFGLLQLAKREYSTALGQDEVLGKLLAGVEQAHFNTRPAGGDQLGAMLSSLFSGQ